MRYFSQKVAGIALAILLGAGATSPVIAETDAIELQDGHPDQYVVVKGDTLWDISGRFLANPWDWPEVWQVNPQIKNPHLIYPGDIIELTYLDGKPRLGLRRGDGHLSPQIRSEDLPPAIPTLPLDAILPFLSRSSVMDNNSASHGPYIVAVADDNLLSSKGDTIYVRGITDPEQTKYEIVRPTGPLRDPETGRVLGYGAIHVGHADLVQGGDPATLFQTTSAIEGLIGDRLIPASGDKELLRNFVLSYPPEDFRTGTIMYVLDGLKEIGQFYTVVINRGSADGVVPGMLATIYRNQGRIRDSVIGGNPVVQLPLEEAGVLVVYRVFDNISLGLVLSATRAMEVGDMVGNRM